MFPVKKENSLIVPDTGFGIYVHWPFCKAKCPYCDFNSHVSETIDHDAWLKAFEKALDYYYPHVKNKTVTSVFFGGGTPSLMKPETVSGILNKIKNDYNCVPDMEVTLEANPTSVEADKFKNFAKAGVNRVSIGVQSFNEKDLKFLGREHNVDEATKAINLARDNFERFSFDLIYARPEQTLKQWEEELLRALDFAVGHISLYQLTIEQGTAFYTRYNRGEFKLPEDNLASDFYDLTKSILEDRGLYNYEVSNYARKGHESRHNLTYWRYGDYLGVGAGAHGRFLSELDGNKYATVEHRAPQIWLENTLNNGSAIKTMEELDKTTQAFETLLMGLRLDEGIFFENLEKNTNLQLFDFIDKNKCLSLQSEGLLEFDNQKIRLTFEGRKRLNSVLEYLIPSDIT